MQIADGVVGGGGLLRQGTTDPGADRLPAFLDAAPRFLFFTGKGGVGKTSVACASAIALADGGKSVLLVSTDPASNLDEMLEVALGGKPTNVPGVSRLSALNIDPEAAAESYRARVLAQMPAGTTLAERESVREQLSGACTTEIAAFDQFVALLAGDIAHFDHVIFDTAPTGHTLRLLSLPKAWTGFLAANDRGASCLGPHSGLKMQEGRFRKAVQALGDARQTTIMLVTRPESGTIREAARTSEELRALGLVNQRLVVNGIFHASSAGDAVAASLERLAQEALDSMPPGLRALPRDEVPLRPFDLIGAASLRALFVSGRVDPPAVARHTASVDLPSLDQLIDRLAANGHGLIMVMGKGGVGKTTIASAIAIGLVGRGHGVHLSTTDPAAHLAMTIEGGLPGLRVDRIDPKAETARYVERIMATRGGDLDAQGRALLAEDLKSPCTEEIAVFNAFSRMVAEARSAFVVLDTAPTGHTLLLMDATGAYHRQMTRHLGADHPGPRIITPLMRLQDPAHTQVILVTLAETTPVSEAALLQDDLRRAQIEPFAWVINRSLIASGTQDPLLRQRMAREEEQIDRVRAGLARRTYFVPWQSEPPIGVRALGRIASARAGGRAKRAGEG